MPENNSSVIRPTLLLINSEPQVRSAIRLELVRQGWNVHPAGNVKRALTNMAGKRIDAILLDTHIDGISGLVLGTLLRKLPAFAGVVFGMTTGRLSPTEELVMQRLQLDFVLRQPIDPNLVGVELQAAIQRRARESASGASFERATKKLRNPEESLENILKDIHIGQEMLERDDASGLQRLGETRGERRSVVRAPSKGFLERGGGASKIRETRDAQDEIARQLSALQNKPGGSSGGVFQFDTAARDHEPKVKHQRLSPDDLKRQFKQSRRRESELMQKARVGLPRKDSNKLREVKSVNEDAAERKARVKEALRLKELQAELRKAARQTGKTLHDDDLSSVHAELQAIQKQLDVLDNPGGLRELAAMQGKKTPFTGGYGGKLDAVKDELRLKELEKALRKEQQQESDAAAAELDALSLQGLNVEGPDYAALAESMGLGDEAPNASQAPAGGELGLDRVDIHDSFDPSETDRFADLADQFAALQSHALKMPEAARGFSDDSLAALRQQMVGLANDSASMSEEEMRRRQEGIAHQLAEAESRARFSVLENKIRGAADHAEDELLSATGPTDIQLMRLRDSLMGIASDATTPLGSDGRDTADISETAERQARRAQLLNDQRFHDLASMLRRSGRDAESIAQALPDGPTDIQLLRLQEQLLKLADDSAAASRGENVTFSEPDAGYWTDRLANAANIIQQKREARERRREERRLERDERIAQQLALRQERRDARQAERSVRFTHSGEHFRDQMEFLGKIEETYELPQAAHNLIDKIEMFEDTPREVSEALDSDQEFVDRLLAFFNSSLYQRETPFENLEQVVEELGAEPVRDIVIGAEAFDVLAGEGHGGELDHRVLWLHSVGVAVVCMRLAQAAKSETRPESLFTSGLLHDMGKVMFDDLVHNDYEQVVKRANEERLDIFDAENTMFETNHSKVARSIMGRWRLPRKMYQAVACHHLKLMSFDSDAIIDPQGCAIVVIANRWMHARGWGDGTKHRQPPIERGWFKLAGVTVDQAKGLFESFESDMRAALGLLDITGFLAAWQRPSYLMRGKQILVVRSPDVALCTIEEGLNLFGDSATYPGTTDSLEEDLAMSNADTVLLYITGLSYRDYEPLIAKLGDVDHVRRVIVVAEPYQEELSNPGVEEFVCRVESSGYSDLLDWKLSGGSSSVGVLTTSDTSSSEAMDIDAADIDIDLNDVDF